MSDIRARLADALREHLLGLHPRNHVTADGSHAYLCSPQLNFDILADVLLSAPGIAIVDTNDEATIDRVAEAIWELSVDPPDIPAYRDMACAALLAAANAAEAQR